MVLLLFEAEFILSNRSGRLGDSATPFTESHIYKILHFGPKEVSPKTVMTMLNSHDTLLNCIGLYCIVRNCSISG